MGTQISSPTFNSNKTIFLVILLLFIVLFLIALSIVIKRQQNTCESLQIDNHTHLFENEWNQVISENTNEIKAYQGYIYGLTDNNKKIKRRSYHQRLRSTRWDPRELVANINNSHVAMTFTVYNETLYYSDAEGRTYARSIISKRPEWFLVANPLVMVDKRPISIVTLKAHKDRLYGIGSDMNIYSITTHLKLQDWVPFEKNSQNYLGKWIDISFSRNNIFAARIGHNIWKKLITDNSKKWTLVTKRNAMLVNKIEIYKDRIYAISKDNKIVYSTGQHDLPSSWHTVPNSEISTSTSSGVISKFTISDDGYMFGISAVKSANFTTLPGDCVGGSGTPHNHSTETDPLDSCKTTCFNTETCAGFSFNPNTPNCFLKDHEFVASCKPQTTDGSTYNGWTFYEKEESDQINSVWMKADPDFTPPDL